MITTGLPIVPISITMSMAIVASIAVTVSISIVAPVTVPIIPVKVFTISVVVTVSRGVMP